MDLEYYLNLSEFGKLIAPIQDKINDIEFVERNNKLVPIIHIYNVYEFIPLIDIIFQLFNVEQKTLIHNFFKPLLRKNTQSGISVLFKNGIVDTIKLYKSLSYTEAIGYDYNEAGVTIKHYKLKNNLLVIEKNSESLSVTVNIPEININGFNMIHSYLRSDNVPYRIYKRETNVSSKLL